MIKEKQKKTKYNYKKSNKILILEYIRTILCSFLLAVVITTVLAIQARNEMIKDIYAYQSEQQSIDRQHALDIITKTSPLRDLEKKKYSVCIHVGELYEMAGDYKDAQRAYELAIEKSRPGTLAPYYKLISVLVAQEKFEDAESVLTNIKDYNSKSLIKFKTRAYLTVGDKYYSIGKFLSAAKKYEKAEFYYSKFAKKDKTIVNSINARIINSYINAADILVKSGLNGDALRFLTKAENYSKDDFRIRYKKAIILSDFDPEKAVEYFEPLLNEIPQEIDYGVYGTALMKAANIADLDNRPTQAKYYRYKLHSTDLFIERKVVYKNDVEINLKSFSLKKEFFNYPLKVIYEFMNTSNSDIINLTGDFVLMIDNKPVETITKVVANKNKPMFSFNSEPSVIDVKFKKKIFTKKELENYSIRIYLYKDKKFKTLVNEIKIPSKSF